MKWSLLLAALGACSPARESPEPEPVFDDPTAFRATPPGCVYQRHEAVNPTTSVGELSQCLELAIVGNDLVSLVYSDFLDPNRGKLYLGGVAGSRLVREGDALVLVTGPHRTRFVPALGRHVLAEGADGTWFEDAGSSAVFVDDNRRVTFTLVADGSLRATRLVTLGGAAGDRPISTITIERNAAGDPTALRDDFGRGIAVAYQGAQLVQIIDLETQRATTVQWAGEQLAAVTALGTSGGAVTTTFAYAGERLAAMSMPELGRVAWDRPQGFQIATTRFVNPYDVTTYAIASLGCVSFLGMRIAGLTGVPYGSDSVPAVFRTEHVLSSDGITARPTKRTTDPIGTFREAQYDAQDRLAVVFDERGTGWAFTYAGATQRIVQQRSAATGVSVFDATLAPDAPTTPRLLYATTAGLDRAQTTYSYDGAGRTIAISNGGRTLRRSFYDLGNSTQFCDQFDGSAVSRCTELDLNGNLLAIYESGIRIASASYTQGRLATTLNSLYQTASLTYSLDRVARVDPGDGRLANDYAYTANGTLASATTGQTGRDFTSSEAGRLEGWRDRVANASWSHAVSRSADLLTTNYFINGHRQWTEQSAPAPAPPALACTSTKETK